MKIYVYPLFAALMFIGCNPSASVDDSKQNRAKTEGFTKSDIIRMPVSANEPVDTTLVAKMEFEETVHEFGTVIEGKFVEHVFKFTNTGKIPLIISDAKATCGCTVPNYPEQPVAPGESGEVSVKFNTAGKKLDQSKPVTLIANTHPSRTVLTMKGYVHPNQQFRETLKKLNQ